MSTIQKINAKAQELGLEIESYNSRQNIQTVQSLHTDTCTFIDFGVSAENDEQIADWGIVSAEDYNATINANCGEIQDDFVIVVVIKR